MLSNKALESIEPGLLTLISDLPFNRPESPHFPYSPPFPRLTFPGLPRPAPIALSPRVSDPGQLRFTLPSPKYEAEAYPAGLS